MSFKRDVFVMKGKKVKHVYILEGSIVKGVTIIALIYDSYVTILWHMNRGHISS